MKKLLSVFLMVVLILTFVSCKEKNDVTYTVSFEVNGGETISPVTVKQGEAVQLPTPVKSGYNFIRWCVDKELTTVCTDKFLATISQNVTVYADWQVKIPDPVYVTITFEKEKDVTEKRMLLVGTELRDLPSPVQKEGYAVVWSITDFSLITEDTTVYPVYTRIYSDNYYRYYLLDNDTFSVEALSESFKSNEELKLTLPAIYEGKAVTEVRENAFEDCTGLLELTLPDSYTKIGKSAFSGCNNLSSITFLGSPEFEEGALYNIINLTFLRLNLKDNTLGKLFGRMKYWHSNEAKQNGETYWVPDLLTKVEYTGQRIPDDGFRNCINISEVKVVSAAFNALGEYAFSGCSSLKTVSFPEGNGLTEIPVGAFSRCTSLINVTKLSSVNILRESAFEYCSSLVSLDTTAPLVEIGKRGFYACVGIRNLNMKDDCVIGADAFLGTNVNK